MLKRLRWMWLFFVVVMLSSCTDDSDSGEISNGDTDLTEVTEESDASEASDSDIEYTFHELLPIPDEGNLADPCVLKVDGTWYLYGTHRSTGFEVWFSDDLKHWEQGETIWTPTLPWQTDHPLCGMWAPHVERAGDTYYLYYTANCRIGVAKADSPLGPFEEVYDHPLIGNGYGGVGDGELAHDIVQDWDDLAIDAFTLQVSDDSLVFYYTGFTPLSTIYAQRMEDFVTVSGEPVLLLEPEVSSWEGFVREGAWVLENEGRFHLMYSGNMFETVDYGIGVATATEPLGPFVRDTRNPILKSNVETGIYGPGHHSVVQGAHNDQLIFYHTKVSSEEGEGRLVRYGPLWFDEEGRVEVEQP